MQLQKTFVAVFLLAITVRSFGATPEFCQSGANDDWVANNPRARIETDGLRICGAPQVGHGSPDEATIVIWDAGAAPWALDAAMRADGVVSIQRRKKAVWTQIKQLRSPMPKAYGNFGINLAASARWLSVLESGTNRVWIFDMRRLSMPAVELLDARGFARSLAMAGDQILVGGSGELRIYRKNENWSIAEKVTAPIDTERVFTGQVKVQGDLLVALSSGIDTGDGLVFPGRVDVFRRVQNRWHWEARLSPDGGDTPFGSACCVQIRNGEIETTFGDGPIRFVKKASGWHVYQGSP